MMNVASGPWLFVVLAAVALSCDGGKALPALTVTSPAFGDGDPIPLRHTCEGEAISPPIWVGNVPEDAAFLALICEDQDVSDGAVHWVLWGLPASNPWIVEDIYRSAEPGQGLFQGAAADGEPGYFAPCPPEGEEHRYDFQVFALDRALDLAPGILAADLRKAMKGRIVAKGSLRGIVRGE